MRKIILVPLLASLITAGLAGLAPRDAEARICCSRCFVEKPPIMCRSGCLLNCRSDEGDEETLSSSLDAEADARVSNFSSSEATSACGSVAGAHLVYDEQAAVCRVAN